jgi:uncharacterized protein YcgL (UPF0745 family)
MHMKNKDLFDLKAVLDEIIKTNYKSSIQFSFNIIKNKKKVEERVEELQEAIKPNAEYLQYDKERIELLKTASTKEDGTIGTKNIGNGNIEYLIIPEKKGEFDKKLAKLQKKYKDSLDKQDEKQKEIIDFLDTEVKDLELIKFKSEDIPEEFKSTHLEKIFDLIEMD